jgi:tol-pal system protein YbgF
MASFHASKNILAAGALLLLLGSLPACVTSKKDFDRLTSRVYAQEQEQARLQERVAKIEGDMARSQPVQANSWAELNSMRSQLAAISGQLEDYRRTQEMQGGVTVESLNAKVQELERRNMFMASQLGVVFEEMPKTETEPAGQGMMPPAPASQAPVAQPPAPATPPGAPAVAQPQAAQPAQPQGGETAASVPGQELYQKALEFFYAMKYKQAQATWAEFVKGFPKDPLVSNAIFWQGECFFQLQDYANAVLTYQKVIEEHSKSNKYRPALLKQGISFYKLKKDQAGKLVLEDLIKKYPNSAEAKRAQAYLKEGK